MDEAARLRVVVEAVGIRETARGLEGVDAGLKRTAVSSEVARSATGRLAKSRADLRLQTVQVQKAELAAASALQKYGAESLQAREASARLAVAQQRVAATSTKLGSSFASVGSGVRGLAGHTRNTDERLQTLARSGQKSARQLGGAFKAAGVGAAIGVGAIIKETVDFDRSMRNVNSIAGLSGKGFKALRQDVLDLAGPTAQAPKTLSEGLYDLVSSGFNARDSMKILNSSAKAATAGLTDTATSTKAVAAVLNAYRLPASAAAKVSDQLFQTVNLGVINFQDLANTIGDVLPFAAQLGVGLDQVGAALSTMTKQGLSGFEATTRLKDAMQAFLKPSEALGKAIDKTGAASGEALIKHKGFQGALEAVVKTTDGSKSAIAALFPNIRALGGALSLTGDNAKGAHRDLQGFGNAAGVTNRVFNEQSKSIAVQWQRATANFKALAIQVGTGLVPILSRAAKSIGRFAQEFREGSGAGGRFRDALEGIWRKAKPVVDFFRDHKSLVGGAIAAWAAYKTAAITAMAVLNFRKIRAVFGGGKAVAFEQGVIAGTAWREGFNVGSGGGTPGVPGIPGGKGAPRVPNAGRSPISTVAKIAAPVALYYALAGGNNTQFASQLPDQLSRFATRDVRGGGGRVIQRGNNLGDLSRQLQAAMDRHDREAIARIANAVKSIAANTRGPNQARIAKLADQIRQLAGSATSNLGDLVKEFARVNKIKISNKTFKILANAKDPREKLAALMAIKFPPKVLRIIARGGTAEQILARIKAYLEGLHDKTVNVTVREQRYVQSVSPSRTEGIGHAPALPPKAAQTKAPKVDPVEAQQEAAQARQKSRDAATKARQRAQDARQKAKDAADRRRQAAEDARQRAISLVEARDAFRKAGTDNPLAQNRIDQHTARAHIRLAADPAERLSARADLRGLRRDAGGLRIQAREDNIQFALDMGKITSDVAANQYEALAKMVHHNKTLRRQLLVTARNLRGQDNQGALELNVGDVRVPTVFEVRRQERSLEPRLISSSRQPTVVHHHATVNVHGAKDPKAVASEVVAIIDRTRRTAGAAARRARGNG